MTPRPFAPEMARTMTPQQRDEGRVLVNWGIVAFVLTIIFIWLMVGLKYIMWSPSLP